MPVTSPGAKPLPQRSRRLIIDGTERRRQRPKSPGKQALHYSGKKKAHTDKNVVIATLPRKRIDFLSHTCVGKTHDKKIADTEGIAYPPEAILYKDTGFQGYNPAVKEARQAEKKAAPRRAQRCGEANEPEVGAHPGQSGACPCRGEALSHCERCIAEHERRGLRFGDGSGLWIAQPSRAESQAAAEKVTDSLFRITSIFSRSSPSIVAQPLLKLDTPSKWSPSTKPSSL